MPESACSGAQQCIPGTAMRGCNTRCRNMQYLSGVGESLDDLERVRVIPTVTCIWTTATSHMHEKISHICPFQLPTAHIFLLERTHRQSCQSNNHNSHTFRISFLSLVGGREARHGLVEPAKRVSIRHDGPQLVGAQHRGPRTLRWTNLR